MVIGVYHKKRWIDGFRRQADTNHPRGSGVKAINVDALALAVFLGIGADIYEILFVACRGCKTSNG
jgi:hypothetical protein